MNEKRALVFCSRSGTIDPKYNEAAREIVRALCGKGYAIVSGGTVKGTMDVICREVEECGGKSIGILPECMRGLDHPGLSETVWTEDISKRKAVMRENVQLVITLPGGIGTMDEFFETFNLLRMDLYRARMIVFNCGGFYDSLKQLLNHFVDSEMLEREAMDKLFFPETVEELTTLV